MSFTEAIKTCFHKYVDFSGRASRSEYWWFFLFTVIARLVAVFIPGVGFIAGLVLLLPSLAAMVRRLHDINRTGWWTLLLAGMGVVGMIPGVYIAVFIGFWAGAKLPEMLPVMIIMASIGALAGGSLGATVGFLILLPFLIQPSDPGDNRYGPSPFPPPPGMGGYGYVDPGQPYAPPYDAAPPDAIPQPGGRQYCSQCGAERVAAEAQFCTVCGSQF